MTSSPRSSSGALAPSFGMSLDEFRRAFEAGELDDNPGALNIAVFLNGPTVGSA